MSFIRAASDLLEEYYQSQGMSLSSQDDEQSLSLEGASPAVHERKRPPQINTRKNKLISLKVIKEDTSPLSIEKTASLETSPVFVGKAASLTTSIISEDKRTSVAITSPITACQTPFVSTTPTKNIDSPKSAEEEEVVNLEMKEGQILFSPLISSPMTSDSEDFYQNLRSEKKREKKAFISKDTVFKNIEKAIKEKKQHMNSFISSPLSSQVESPFSFRSPLSHSSLGSFTWDLGYTGKGQKLKAFQSLYSLKSESSSSPLRPKLDPMIYWEQKTGLAFCTLNLDYQAIGEKFYKEGETLWDVYAKMILDHPDSEINTYPFDEWFQLFIEYLPNNHVFKDYYLKGSEKKLFTLTVLDENSLKKCEFKWIGDKAYVRGDHLNKPFDKSEIDPSKPLDEQWLLLDTTLFASKSLEEKKNHLIEKEAKTSNRDPQKMIYVKNITRGSQYILIDQPGKIYHSTCIQKLFTEEGFKLPEENYDGGTCIFEKGICRYVANDSGHIRSSKENYLHRGLIKNIIDAKAHKELKEFSAYYINKNGEHKVIHKRGSQNIENYFQSEGLFHKKSPFYYYLSIKQKKYQKRKILRAHFDQNAKIIQQIHARIKKLTISPHLDMDRRPRSFENAFLTAIVENYRDDLKQAANIAKEMIPASQYSKLISPKKFFLFQSLSETQKILKKIDALPYAGVSFISQKKKF